MSGLAGLRLMHKPLFRAVVPQGVILHRRGCANSTQDCQKNSDRERKLLHGGQSFYPNAQQKKPTGSKPAV
jgi:hypothetical protein